MPRPPPGTRGRWSYPAPGCPVVSNSDTIQGVKRKHAKVLAAIFAHPTPANIRWRDIEALFESLGGRVEEREGSRIAVILFGQVQV